MSTAMHDAPPSSILSRSKHTMLGLRLPSLSFLLAIATALFLAPAALASEASLVVPDLGSQDFLGMPGDTLLTIGIGVCILGLIFGLVIFTQLKNMPVHQSMREISELIYETCKTYLLTQGRFLLVLWAFIAVIMGWYFGWLSPHEDASGEIHSGMELGKVAIILVCSLVGIAGSYGVAWFGIRINTFANSRTAYAALPGKPYPAHAIPLKAGMSIGMALISIELTVMLIILLWIPGDYAGPCFIGFAIGESLGASALRIAGGIFTKIADIGSDLMKIVLGIKEDDARNPGVIADCTGDNAGDSVGPTADGFETYGVTGVALISFILLAVNAALFLPAGVTDATATEAQRGTAAAEAAGIQVQLLVWIFAMRIMMIIASGGSYLINAMLTKAKYATADKMDFEHPLTILVWLTSIVSILLTFLVSWLMIPNVHGDETLWWKLSIIISCGTIAGAVIPELVKIFTSTKSKHVREVLTSSREGGASLNILSGLTAGNFSAFWMGLAIIALMAIAYLVSTTFPAGVMQAEAVFAFGLVAFGFLGMGPVTIAVDSYGPVTDNAQSVYELSLIESQPGVSEEVQRTFGHRADFVKAKHILEENDGAGNTFKATAKPVLIGTAVVGATTMIFAIIVVLTESLTTNVEKLSLLHAPFLLGILTGGAVIYWFTGASTQAVVTGAYRAVEFIKRNIKLEGGATASISDSKKVVEICTVYAQKGMVNIFFAVFFGTLAYAFIEEYFFIGYLIGIAFFGLYQAIFMANAGGAWDNAKKLVEVDLKEKGTPLHAAAVVGDTVGDPFKDTSSVAMNPIIKFTTLFGLLAVELAVAMKHGEGSEDGIGLAEILAGVFFVISLVFVWRSFYAMRIRAGE